VPDSPSAVSARIVRLRDGRAISSTLRHGDRRAGRFVALHVRVRPAAQNDDDGSALSRFAVVASKKVGGAVVRNRAKRLLREAVGHAAVPPASDSVLVARPGCGQARAQEVSQEVADLYKRLSERLPHQEAKP